LGLRKRELDGGGEELGWGWRRKEGRVGKDGGKGSGFWGKNCRGEERGGGRGWVRCRRGGGERGVWWEWKWGGEGGRGGGCGD